MPSLNGATEWLNSKPLARKDLQGKVVLVDFWTYSCINWRRAQPYIRAWADKYRDKGLVVIGVHSPEFQFEKDVSNVRQALKEVDIHYPVLVDSDHAIWRAFENNYWPALYLVDARSRIRYHKFGEGDYEVSERAIQALLVEAGASGIDSQPISVQGRGPEAAPDWDNLRSPENYLGHERTENFESSGGREKDKPHKYAAPGELRLNHWSLSGDWSVHAQEIHLNKSNGRILYRFHARDLHLVMGPANRGAAVRFRVLIDGHAPGDAHGVDVDEQGNGTMSEPKMYQLIRQPAPIQDRLFEIEFLDPGVKAYSFTFG
jgi:thiol-disulfide isomerase/thioredoxin